MQPAAELIRAARHEAGLSQAEVARRAGTSQPALARYESGAVTPSLNTLQRLMRACGRSLRLGSAQARAEADLGVARERILASARRHHMHDVRVVGSFARGDHDDESDVDLLVELGPGGTLLDIAAFRRETEAIVGRGVDVVAPRLLKEGVRPSAFADAVPI